MPAKKDNDSRTYEILVYGIERKGLTAPREPLRHRNFTLSFEPFATSRRFTDFNGVIIFQGIFETIEYVHPPYGRTYAKHRYDRDELDKRKKELMQLLGKKGFVCFLLCQRFIDREDGKDFRSTDLTKVHLNYDSFYRENFEQRATYLTSIRSELNDFLGIYGAASSYFKNHNQNIEWRPLARAEGHTVGMILWDRELFVPSLIPENTPERVEEYFRLLADAVTSILNKLSYEIPEWVDAFVFSEEVELKEKREQLLQEVEAINRRVESFRRYKRIILVDGDPLVDAVVDALRTGFGLTVDDSDEYREDIKILDQKGDPLIFCEIKGTNSGVKRAYISQADSHRDRAGYPAEFPTVLIINTHIKNARNLAEKDQEVADEQVRHAAATNVLVVRTLDLLQLLKLKMDNQISQDEVLVLFSNNRGWLKVSSDGWEIVQG